LATHAAPVGVHQPPVGDDLHHLALVLVGLPFERALEHHGTAGFPVGLDVGAEEILLDEFRLGQGIPYLVDRCVDEHRGMCDMILHDVILIVLTMPQHASDIECYSMNYHADLTVDTLPT